MAVHPILSFPIRHALVAALAALMLCAGAALAQEDEVGEGDATGPSGAAGLFKKSVPPLIPQPFGALPDLSEATEGDTADATEDQQPPAEPASAEPPAAAPDDIPRAAPADPQGVIAETVPNPDNPTTGPESSPPANERPASPTRPQARPERAAQSPEPEDTAPPPPQPAAIAPPCLTDRDRADPDILRNLQSFVARPDLCVTHTVLREHDRTWHFQTLTAQPAAPGSHPLWILFDDSDDAGFDAALRLLARFGGTFLTLDMAEAARVPGNGSTKSEGPTGQSPAQNLGGTDRLTAGCADMQTRPAPGFTDAVNTLIPDRAVIAIVDSNATADAPLLTISGFDPLPADATAQTLIATARGQGIATQYTQIDIDRFDCSLTAHLLHQKLGPVVRITLPPAMDTPAIERLGSVLLQAS